MVNLMRWVGDRRSCPRQMRGATILEEPLERDDSASARRVREKRPILPAAEPGEDDKGQETLSPFPLTDLVEDAIVSKAAP